MKSTKLYFSEGSSIPEFALAEGLAGPETLAPSSEFPDGRMYLTDNAGPVIAHAALWWRDTPCHEGLPVGTIGGFAAIDEDAARLLLHGAVEKMGESGAKIVVGPMNGNTWRRHRFVVESGGRVPFLLEPRNPGEYSGWWESSGFSVLSRYSSSVMQLDGTGTMPDAVKSRLEHSGVTIRKLDVSCYEDELRLIHEISLKSFSGNFLYTPLEEEAFLDAYRKVRDHLDPAFVRIAERNGEPCGFVFGITDLEAAARGEKPALIVKTLAVDPAAKCAGLGTLLVDEIHRAAWEKGYSEAIHALQHETNTSLKITGRHQGEVLRRYALFSRRP